MAMSLIIIGFLFVGVWIYSFVFLDLAWLGKINTSRRFFTNLTRGGKELVDRLGIQQLFTWLVSKVLLYGSSMTLILFFHTCIVW